MRIRYLDMFRGMLILIMVWVHTRFVTDDSNMKLAILSAFFFLSGINFKSQPIKQSLIQSVKRVLVPFIVYYTLALIALLIFDAIQDPEHIPALLHNYFTNPFASQPGFLYMVINTPLWFLLCLFNVRVIAAAMLRLPRWAIALSIILPQPFMWRILYDWSTPFLINNAVYWYSFFATGYLVGKPMIKYLTGSHNRGIVMAITGSILIFTACYCFIWWHFDPRHMIHIVSFFAVDFFMMALLASIEKWRVMRIFELLGLYSLFIYGVHWILIEWYFRFVNPFETMSNLEGAIVAAVVLGILVGIRVLLKNKHPLKKFGGIKNNS